MDVRKTVLFILLLLSTAFPSLNAQCIPFVVSHKRIILKVEVNGRGPFNFLLDSGSTATVLDKSIAKDLPPNGRVQLMGIGEREVVDSRIADITVGGVTDKELPVLVVDLKKTEAVGETPTFGILGNDVALDAGFISIDYGNSTVCIGH